MLGDEARQISLDSTYTTYMLINYLIYISTEVKCRNEIHPYPVLMMRTGHASNTSKTYWHQKIVQFLFITI